MAEAGGSNENAPALFCRIAGCPAQLIHSAHLQLQRKHRNLLKHFLGRELRNYLVCRAGANIHAVEAVCPPKRRRISRTGLARGRGLRRPDSSGHGGARRFGLGSRRCRRREEQAVSSFRPLRCSITPSFCAASRPGGGHVPGAIREALDAFRFRTAGRGPAAAPTYFERGRSDAKRVRRRRLPRGIADEAKRPHADSSGGDTSSHLS